MAQVTLADSLRDRLEWQVYNFGWNGPRPPYVRLGMRLFWNPVRLEPCFESFLRDRFISRSSTLVRDHLAPFNWILVEQHAFDESYPRGYAQQVGFPVGHWLSVRAVDLHYLRLADGDGAVHAMPLEVLCASASIQLDT